MIDTCPKCGRKYTLQAIIDVPAYYSIYNRTGRDGKPVDQLWEIHHVTEDGACEKPFEIKCEGCNSFWPEGEFELDVYGNLVKLYGENEEDD